jgi:peptide/nickel transport system substrate-binding protein
MSIPHKPRRRMGAVIAIALVAVGLSACGSGGAGALDTGGTGAPVLKIKQTGPGLTQPTTGHGSKVEGGTATFAEAPASPPNYIFPMYSVEYCSSNNIDDLDSLLYRPLYWFGNNYSPTVDYNESIGEKPVFSDGDKTVTIHLKHFMWSDGEQVSARDLVFWMNVLKADPSKEWCDTVPGKFPGNVTSYKAINTTTFQMTMNRAYNPTWFLYNELSQLTPMPIAWDRTSLSQPAPSPTAANLPDTTKSSAGAVYDFLNQQSTKLSSWGSSPLWSIVDGPWKVQSTTSNGGVTFVPNGHYSGSVKASLAKFVEVPFTSESAMINEIKSQGTRALTVAYIPSQYAPLTKSFEGQGYDVNMASTYILNYFPLNLNAPTVGKVFQQLYFRQAFQHLVDQQGWIDHFLHGAGVPTYGPVPLAPKSDLVDTGSETDLYPFSTAEAAKMLKQHGWKVVPGGTTICEKPGSGAGDCGAGITKGQGIAFNIDYESGVTSVSEEMEDLQSQASKVGIKIDLTTHPFDDVASAATHCNAGAADCKWTAENWGAGWAYSWYPSGEALFSSTSVSNASNYANPKMDKLINATITATPKQEPAAMAAYVKYTEQQIPAVWLPEAVGSFGTPSAGSLIDAKLGGFAANSGGDITPENWYFTK